MVVRDEVTVLVIIVIIIIFIMIIIVIIQICLLSSLLVLLLLIIIIIIPDSLGTEFVCLLDTHTHTHTHTHGRTLFCGFLYYAFVKFSVCVCMCIQSYCRSFNVFIVKAENLVTILWINSRSLIEECFRSQTFRPIWDHPHMSGQDPDSILLFSKVSFKANNIIWEKIFNVAL